MHNTSYNKYSNNPTFQDNIRFASKKEAMRYSELKLLEKAGEIKDLTLQQPFVLEPAFVRDGIKYRAIIYVADFFYWNAKNPDITIVEDTKGYRTDVYKLKKKLFLARYPTLSFVEI